MRMRPVAGPRLPFPHEPMKGAHRDARSLCGDIAPTRFRATLQGAALRQAKEVLAFEVTALTHGVDAAHTAQNAARALFDGVGEMAGAVAAEAAISRGALEPKATSSPSSATSAMGDSLVGGLRIEQRVAF